MKKIESAAYPELEYALAKYYDIVVERYIQFVNDTKTGRGFSAAELALDSAKKLRELVVQQQMSYTNNTKGD
jgi:ribosomal protein L13E